VLIFHAQKSIAINQKEKLLRKIKASKENELYYSSFIFYIYMKSKVYIEKIKITVCREKKLQTNCRKQIKVEYFF